MTMKLLQDKQLLNNILRQTGKDGAFGNDQAKKIILLACISTLNQNPDYTLSVIVEGEAGIGKTLLVKSILSLFPEDKIFQRSRMTPKALEYLDEDLDRKIVFIEELSGNEGTYNTKIAMSEHELKLETVENKKGTNTTDTKVLSAKGTSFITTTTQGPSDIELESRIVRVHADRSEEYISGVIDSILEKAVHPNYRKVIKETNSSHE